VSVASGATFSATNDTISGDSAGQGVSGSFTAGNQGTGGGLSVSGGTAILASVTIANDSANGDGDGISNQGGHVTLTATLIDEGPSRNDCGGTQPSDGGYNLEYGGGICIASDHHENPVLGPLQNNGGPTQTMALSASSPAIELVPKADCPATDQRGVTRPQVGDECDVGAYEAGPPSTALSPLSLSFSSSTLGASTPSQSVTVTDDGASSLSVGAVSLSGPDAGDFKVSSDGCSGQNVLALDSCTVSVSFVPHGLSTATAKLSISDNAADSPQQVSLSGTLALVSPRIVGPLGIAAGGVSFKLHCGGPAGSECVSTATLSAVEQLQGGKVVIAVARRAKKRKRTVTFAKFTAKIRRGQTKRVALKLDRSGRKLLKSLGKLRLKLMIFSDYGSKHVEVATRAVTIRAAIARVQSRGQAGRRG